MAHQHIIGHSVPQTRSSYRIPALPKEGQPSRGHRQHYFHHFQLENSQWCQREITWQDIFKNFTPRITTRAKNSVPRTGTKANITARMTVNLRFRNESGIDVTRGQVRMPPQRDDARSQTVIVVLVASHLASVSLVCGRRISC